MTLTFPSGSVVIGGVSGPESLSPAAHVPLKALLAPFSVAVTRDSCNVILYRYMDIHIDLPIGGVVLRDRLTTQASIKTRPLLN